MATQSTTSGAPVLNIGKSINTTPATPQQNQAFAPPAVNQPSSGGSVWSGVGGLLSSFLAGGAPQVAGTNQTTPGGSTPPNVGTMAQPLPSTGTPKPNPTAPAPSQPASNPFIPTANAQTSTPTLGGGGVKAPQGMEYGPTGQLQPTSTNSGVAQYTTPDQAQTPNSGFQTVTGPNGAPEAVPNGSSLDAQGNIVKNSPNVNVGGDTSNSGNDRFSQLNAIIQNLQSAGNITPEEQALKDQLATQEADTSLGLAHIAGTPEPMELATGQSNVLQQQGLAKANLLTNQIANLQAQRQAKLQSGTAAAGAEQALQGFQQPVSVSPGNALISPFTGQQVGGNATLSQLSGGSAGGFIGSLAQDVASGNVSYADAVSQLPSSSQAPALLQAIKGLNPGFSITTSNQNAQTRGSALQQQSSDVRPLVASQQTAIQHLNNLKKILTTINYSNVPFFNGVRDWYSNNVSKDPNIAQAQSELNIVRSEVAKVLGGGTVTVESQNEAQSVVPGDISPGTFEQVANNVKALMESKITQATNSLNNVQQFSNGNTPGNNGSNQNATSNPYSF